jgi:3-isopropylmalate/(R)-2-methylmalate dehydratase large subunit
MALKIEGVPAPGVTAKDVILGIIAQYGTDFGTGFVIEYMGEAVRAMSMEERMTVCNMTIEAGARAGLIAPDETTFAYLKGRQQLPQGDAWQALVAQWQTLKSDDDAVFDEVLTFDAAALAPQVTWGTSPGMGGPVTGTVPDPMSFKDPARQEAVRAALKYMDLTPGTPMSEIAIDYCFIGSCTNGRIEDLREAAAVIKGKTVADNVRGILVPATPAVYSQALEEGLIKIFMDSGFCVLNPTCGACLGMSSGVLADGEVCASTTNRNFNGRMGKGGMVHLMSPASAAAAAVTGIITDPRPFLN